MQKASLKQNIISNFAGQGWSSLIGMVAIPLYIKFLGIEGYGLIGFYTTLQATFNSFLDFGLSMTINREVARYTALPEKIGQTRDLVRTIEIGYWIMGLLIGSGVCLSASFIADYWIQAENISSSLIRNVVIIMGIITFLQWPLTFYQGGLLGLQQMVALNTIGIVFNTVRAVGAILLLWNFSPAILVFFLWQVIISLLQVFATALLLWRSLPLSDHAPIFQLKLLTDTWHFAAGVTGTSFVAFFLEQADKLILSKFLSLEFFGYYSLATTLNSQFQLIGAQIFRPLFPRFAALVASNAVEELRNLYHKSCQLVSVIILPIAAIVALFSYRLIQVWTQDSTTATMTAPIVALLFISTALYNLLDVQYSLVVAYGWTKLGFFQQLISAIVWIPLMVMLTLQFGGVGAAFTKVLLYLAYLIFIPPIVYRKFPVLEGRLMRFYATDTGLPLLAVLTVVGIGYWLIPPTLSTVPFLVLMVLVTLITFGAAILSAGEIRNWAYEQFGTLYKRMSSA
ncbi:MAG TPA: oligosaccharide flippase family protein [Anaerolineales bacterium]|nr:oligosaccharide flippase family protein [Anaerolineales bacterium]